MNDEYAQYFKLLLDFNIDGDQIHQDPDTGMYTFSDLAMNAAKEQLLAELDDQAREAINTLRIAFTLQMQLQGQVVPHTWDAMDILYRKWVLSYIVEAESIPTPEMKHAWEDSWESEAHD
jgi:hypothetical protein